jgi:hypothetical protein
MADIPHALPPMGPESSPSFQMVKVLNRNPFVIIDRWDGVPYLFKAEPLGTTSVGLSIPPDAAAHFFAWPAEPEVVRFYIAKRHGWNTPEDIARADKDGNPLDPTGANRMRWELWVEKLEISAVHFDLVQRDPDAPIPADAGDPEDAAMTESGNDLPLPMAAGPDTSGTKVGTRKRSRPPRRIEP